MGGFKDCVRRVVSYPDEYERQDGDIAVFLDGWAEGDWKDDAFDVIRHYYLPWFEDVVIVDPLTPDASHDEWCSEQIARCDAYSALYGVGSSPFSRYGHLVGHDGESTLHANTFRSVISIETGYRWQGALLDDFMRSPVIDTDRMPFLEYTDYRDDDYAIERVDAQTHGESIARLVRGIVDGREGLTRRQ